MFAKRLVPTLLLLYVGSQALDSPLRWILSSVGLAPLIYLRDGALLLVVALSVFADFEQRRHCIPKLALLVGFTTLACIALLNDLPAGQMLFGLKVWLPFIAAYCALDSGLLDTDQWRKPAIALLVITLVGLVLNYYWRPPWIGLTLEVAGADVVGNREWTTYGIRRLSGFARSSYDAAMLLLLLSVYLLSVTRALLGHLLIAAAIGGGIALTTSKGALGSFMMVAALVPTLSSGLGMARLAGPLCRLMTLGFALMGLLAPFWSAVSSAPEFQAGSLAQKIMASMVARGWETWPSAFALLTGDLQLVFGRGLGGIGVAQGLFESSVANPADNFAVYLYVTGGLLGVLFYVALATWAFPRRMETAAERMQGLALLATFCYGVTAGIVENALFAITLGLVMRGAVRSVAPAPAATVSRVDPISQPAT